MVQEVHAYKTLDGKVFENEGAASQHAGKRYADVLCRMSHRLVQIEKYAAMTEMLDSDEVQEELKRLATLKADCTVNYLED